MGDPNTKIAKKFEKVSSFWSEFLTYNNIQDQQLSSAEAEPPPTEDQADSSSPGASTALQRYLEWAQGCLNDPSRAFHPADYEYLQHHLTPEALAELTRLVFPDDAPAPAAPQHIKGDPTTARIILVTMRPTKPARMSRVTSNVDLEGFSVATEATAAMIDAAAEAVLIQLGPQATALAGRGARMDLRDKAAILASEPSLMPYGPRTKKGRRMRNEQKRILSQFGLDENALTAAVNASGIDAAATAAALKDFYEGSTWRLLVQADILDSHIAGGDWYGWLNHDRAYQTNNSLLESVRTDGGIEPGSLTFPPEHFAEISIFPYHIDLKFSQIAALLPNEIVKDMPSVKLGLKLIKSIAKGNQERMLILRGDEEIAFCMENVSRVCKAAKKGHVFTYANPSSRYTTFNNLVKLRYGERLYRGGEEDKLSAFIPQERHDDESKEQEVDPRHEYFTRLKDPVLLQQSTEKKDED